MENPFSIAPDPCYLYMSGTHQDGLTHLQQGLSATSCITLLTGETGTGKTSLCRFFLDRLDPTATVALIVNPGLNAFDLLAAICDAFKVSGKENFSSSGDYLDALDDFLLQGHADDNPAVLVIDGAQNLDKDALETVRLLTDFETNRRRPLKVILLGRPELATLLTSPDLGQLNQRITGRFHLEGLNLEETAAYIRHRLLLAGNGQNELFDRNTMKRIHQLTSGIPRFINTLCDRSLAEACAAGKRRVETAILRKAAREIFGFDHTVKTIEIPVHSLILGAMSLIIVVFFWVGSTSDLFHLNLERILSAPSDQRATPPAASIEQGESGLDAAPEGPASAALDTSMPSHSTVDQGIKSDGGSPAASADEDETEPAGQNAESGAAAAQNNIFIAPVEISARRRTEADTKIIINGIEITE